MLPGPPLLIQRRVFYFQERTTDARPTRRPGYTRRSSTGSKSTSLLHHTSRNWNSATPRINAQRLSHCTNTDCWSPFSGDASRSCIRRLASKKVRKVAGFSAHGRVRKKSGGWQCRFMSRKRRPSRIPSVPTCPILAARAFFYRAGCGLHGCATTAPRLGFTSQGGRAGTGARSSGDAGELCCWS